MRRFLVLLLMVGCADVSGTDSGLGTDTEADTHLNANVTVDAEWRACATADDCVVVSAVCDECCEYHAVNGANVAVYVDHYDDSCEGFAGGECDCMPHDNVLTCEEQLCVVTTTFEDLPE